MLRIQDPVIFWPLFPGPRSGMNFFCILDLGFRFPDPTYELSPFFFVKIVKILCRFTYIFFNIVKYMAIKRQLIFSPFSFVLLLDRGWKNRDPGQTSQILKYCISVYCFYPYAYMKDVQATGEVSSPRNSKKNIQNSKQYISLLFSCLLVLFRPPESGSSWPKKNVFQCGSGYTTQIQKLASSCSSEKKFKWDKDHFLGCFHQLS